MRFISEQTHSSPGEEEQQRPLCRLQLPPARQGKRNSQWGRSRRCKELTKPRRWSSVTETGSKCLHQNMTTNVSFIHALAHWDHRRKKVSVPWSSWPSYEQAKGQQGEVSAMAKGCRGSDPERYLKYSSCQPRPLTCAKFWTHEGVNWQIRMECCSSYKEQHIQWQGHGLMEGTL